MKTSTTLATIAFLSIGLAFAPTADAKKKSSKRAKKAAAAKTTSANPKVKNFDFMADDITADRIRPDGTAIFGLQAVDHKSLIRLRTEFIAEIVKSAEML